MLDIPDHADGLKIARLFARAVIEQQARSQRIALRPVTLNQHLFNVGGPFASAPGPRSVTKGLIYFYSRSVSSSG